MKMPYLDIIIKELEIGNVFIEKTFGNNLHFGYWDLTSKPNTSIEGFEIASRRMNEVCLSGRIETHENISVLDVGCGFGGTLRWMDEHVKGSILSGINIDPRQIEIAKQKSNLDSSNGNIIEFKVASAMDLPYANESQNLIFSLECMSHFPSRKIFLQEAYRVLKPGGTLIITDWLMNHTSIIKNFFLFLRNIKKSQRLYGKRSLPYNKKKYKSIAYELGFTNGMFLDINENTLPSFDLFRDVASHLGNAEKIFREGNEFSELICRRGLSRYYIISFRK